MLFEEEHPELHTGTGVDSDEHGFESSGSDGTIDSSVPTFVLPASLTGVLLYCCVPCDAW